MANLELLVNELPKLIQSLKLTIGNSREIMQQIIPINNAHEQLKNIQKLIAQELNFNNIKSSSVTLPRTGTVTSLFMPNIELVNLGIAANFGNLETKLSLTDLQKKIEVWIEWGYFLQALAADILSDVQLVNQLNFDSQHLSLPNRFKAIAENLQINLIDNYNNLQCQLQKISNYQKELLQLQQKINDIYNAIKNSHSLLDILLGVSAFCGKSGFTLEWLDDDHELIISSDGKVQELTYILNDCDIFKEQIATLIIQADILREQAENALKKIEQQSTKKIIIHKWLENLTTFFIQEIAGSVFILISILLFSFNFSQRQDQNSQLQSISLTQEQKAIANFQSAQQLAMQAASLVQKPPHSLPVWLEAETKWYQAIYLLDNIPAQTSVDQQAKNKLADYRINYNAISQRVLTEKKAVTNFKQAQKLAIEATLFVQNSPYSLRIRQQAKNKWKQAINILEAIPENSSVSIQAKETLPIYKANYAAIK
ncbi:hypothetical protein [Nostoc sp. PA-18-2419]|uniref:hypothetical protein n=1 Tax=Nostoc sp. PA-18-2419 TaxID=2575443 RepID=UPI001109CBD5|nr:hypothetical protein [Nostoc sp. PA-18-2419]